MSINVFESGDEAVQALAHFFIDTAEKAIAYKGYFTVALSGGSSPKKLYELLATDYSDKTNWSKVLFFFGDERYVPLDHPDSNALMASKSLFEPLNIDASQIFAVDTSLDPAAAAAKYMETILAHIPHHPVQFDLVLLGLGDDAHTASLFPGASVLKEKEATVKEVYLEDKKIFRITLTAPLINDAHHVAFLVYGQSKAHAINKVLEGEKNTQLYPAQMIHPSEGKLYWFLDKKAAEAIHH
ncbi:MAG: 6-phosphogluconolactonase [Flavitalea sp.]